MEFHDLLLIDWELPDMTGIVKMVRTIIDWHVPVLCAPSSPRGRAPGRQSSPYGQVVDQARAKQMHIEFSCALEEGVWVRGNSEYLERATVNLLSNAIKYAPEHTAIELAVGADGAQAICSVRDQHQR